MASTALTSVSERRARHSGQGRAAGAVASAPVSFTMPMPPSVNSIFKNLPGKGRVKTSAYDDWRAMAATAVRLQKPSRVDGNVVVIFGVERMSLSADVDNRIKAMLDAMVEAGVILDDRMVTGFAVAWLPAANRLAHITVLPVQAIDLKFYPSNEGSTGGWFLIAPQPEMELPDGAFHP